MKSTKKKDPQEQSAKSLIEAQEKRMRNEDDADGDGAGGEAPTSEYNYVCLETGKTFETHDEPAEFSPFTGGRDIEPIEGFGEEDYMQNTGLPGNQKDPFKQTPLSANPTDKEVIDWLQQNSPNPGEDAQGMIGDTDADSDGFVGYKETPVPPHQDKKPNEKT